MPDVSRMAPVLGVALVAIVIFIVFMADDSGKGKEATSTDVNTGVGQGATRGNEGAAIPAQTASSQGMPAAQSPAAGDTGGGKSSSAPMLAGLVAGLEAKVKADPSNLNNKLLLAQTYAELGRFDDGVKLLREVQSSNGNDPQVKLVAAMVLGKSDNPEYLKEALKLLDNIGAVNPGQKGQAILQKGRVLKKMGDVAAARTTWQEGAAQLQTGDPMRKEIEKELATL